MHRAQVPLRWADQDVQGHVNNAIFAEYLQEARASLLLTGEARGLVGSGCVVVGHQIEYRRSIHFSRTPLDVRVGIGEVGAARFQVVYELVQDDALCARATTTLCPFDFDTQRPRRLAEVEREWMRKVREDWEQLAPVHSIALRGRGFQHPIWVRWGDVDRYGHVNNVRFLEYVQEARVAITETLDPTVQRGSEDHRYVVARQDLDYVAQMSCRPEPYTVLTAPVRIGSSSVVFAAEVVDPLDDHAVLARSRVVWVHTDGTGTPAPLPDSTREALEPLLVD